MQGRSVFWLNILGRLVYLAGTSLIIVLAGGGAKFYRSPLGAAYLCLWNIWWIITFLGRQRGEETPFDKGQKWLVILSGSVSVPFLIIVPPWEYACFSGPLPRAGTAAWIGLMLFMLGIVLQAIAMWQLRSYYTVRLGVRDDQQLVTAGLYHWIRHPGYLSYLVSILGISLAMSSVAMLVFTVLIFIFIRVRISSEEKMLLQVFGEQYAAYRRRTKSLIPFIW